MQNRLWQRVLLGGLVSAAVIAPGAFAHPDSANPTHQHPADAPPVSPEDAARRAEVVASYDGAPGGARETITVGEIEDAMSASDTLSEERATGADARKALLDRTLRFELLAAEAVRRGYDKNASVVQTVKQNAVQAMLKTDIDAKVNPKTVPPEQVKKYYDEHITEFVRPELRRASQVVLATEAEAKALLEDAKKADMRGFRELARTKSIDEESKLRGGDLRYFDAKGKPDEPGANLDPRVAKAVFALKTAGDTTGIVKTDAGFVVLKLTGVRPPQDEKLKAAEDRIRMRLWRELREKAIDDLVANIKAEGKAELHPELLDQISFGTNAPTPPNAGLPSGFPHTKPPPVPTPKE